MRPSRIKAKLKRNEPVLLTMLHLTDPAVYEMTSLLGIDGIWLDLEHHGTDVGRAAEMMRAARVGTSDIVARPAKGEFMRLGRLLEVGANGIVYPRCDDAAEAREVVTWSKFGPLGRRGIDGTNADNPYLTAPIDRYIREANEGTLLMVQVEDARAVANAGAIAAVEGVDAIFLGPADFTIDGGFPGQFDHPKLWDAIRTIADAAAKAGKHWGMPTFSPEHAHKLLDMGARLFLYSSDIVMVRSCLLDMQRQFAPLGVTFGG